MTTRHDSRRSHVKPRPPSDGRPAPARVKTRTPSPTRVSAHRPIRTTARTPILARLGLIAAIGLLSVAVLYIGMAGVGSVAGSIGKALTGFVSNVTATPSPTPALVSVSDPPIIAQPDEPYTSDATANLLVTVPKAVVGDADSKIKVYLALPDQKSTPILQVPIGDTQQQVVPVDLTDGINDFTVTIVGPGGESDKSAVVRYVLDTTPPKIAITSPKNGATINGNVVELKGKVQALSTLIARNTANGTAVNGEAAVDGTFDIKVPLATGSNKIGISATDPAGNNATATITVKRGAGKLTATLTASAYSIKRSALPEPITLSVLVTDPNGNPVASAAVTFTLSLTGIPIISQDTTTDPTGNASFTTTIPKGTAAGQGSATVLVTTQQFGTTQDYTVITIK